MIQFLISNQYSIWKFLPLPYQTKSVTSARYCHSTLSSHRTSELSKELKQFQKRSKIYTKKYNAALCLILRCQQGKFLCVGCFPIFNYTAKLIMAKIQIACISYGPESVQESNY